MIYNEKLKILFHPRTGSVAISEALGWTRGPRHHSLTDEVPGDQATVCVIRHPYELLRTWFALNDWSSFHNFIPYYTHSELEHNGRLFYHLPTTYVINYSYLEEGLNIILMRYSLPCVKLPQRNVTHQKKPHLDGHAKMLIRKRWPKDCAYYEDGTFPNRILF